MRIAEALKRDHTLILDGGLATELERHGADLNHPLWSARLLMETPELIRRVHLDYLRSGADIITSASYQASHTAMQRCGYSHEDADAAIMLGISLAAEARRQYQDENQRAVFVAGSIGPYGAMLHDGSEYTGRYSISDSELKVFHEPRLAVLNQSQADVLAIETIPSVLELKVLIQLLEQSRGPDAWVSMSCADDVHACDGTPMVECAKIAAGCDRVIAFGVNCTAPQFVPELLKRIRLVTDKPMVVYPNSGERYDVVSGIWNSCDVDGLPKIQSVLHWQSLGARLIGGCCRTTPDWIARVSQAIKTERN